MSPPTNDLRRAETLHHDERALFESVREHCTTLDCVHVEVEGKKYEWVVREQDLPQEWIQVLKELKAGETARLEGKQTLIDTPSSFEVKLTKIVRGRKIDSAYVWIDRKDKQSKQPKLKPLSVLQLRITDRRREAAVSEEQILLGETEISSVLESTLYKMRVGDKAKIIDTEKRADKDEIEETRIDVEVLNHRTEKKPSDPVAVLKRAQELKEMGNKWLAKSECSKAIERYQTASEFLGDECKEAEDRKVKAAVLSNLALAHLKLGTKVHADSCVFCCDQVSELQPPTAKIMFRRGQALEIMENFEEAEWQYKEALKVEPENAGVISALNNLSRENKKRQIAEKQTAAKAFSKPLGFSPATSTSEKNIRNTTDKYGNYVFQLNNEFDNDPSPPIDSPDLRKRVLAIEAVLKKEKDEKSHLWYDLGWVLETMEENARAFPCFLVRPEENLLELAVCGAALDGVEFGKQFLRQWAAPEVESDEEKKVNLKDLLIAAQSGMEREQALGIFYYFVQEFQKSAAHFARGLKLTKTAHHQELLWSRLGAALTNGKQYKEAVTCTSMSLSLNKHSPKAWENLSLALGNLDRQGEQKYALIEACKLYDKDAIAEQISDIDVEPKEFDITKNVANAEAVVLKIIEQAN